MEPITSEAASTPAERELLEEIPLSQIDPSPTNPRKRFDPTKLRELADSIAAKGLISPVVLRPLSGARYELVVGERRYRASKLAGRATILSVVRSLSDREVCELQLEENGQREDVHPLEEADAYQHLQRQGAELEELAARTGKPVGYVRQRLQYCALVTEAREAFLDGKLSPATALLVARIPVPKLQADAVKELIRPDQDGDVMTAGEAGRYIRGRFMLQLATAPFDRGDAALIEGVPACTTCPKRTGAQPELFADVQSPDTCTDPNCFSAKKDADWKKRTAAAKREGKAVLAEKDAKAVFSYGGHLAYNTDFVDLASKPHEYGNDGKKTLKNLLGKGHLPPITVARDGDGGVHELVRKSDIAKALKAAGIEKAASTSPSSVEEKKRRERQKIMRATLDRVLALLVTAAELVKPGRGFFQFLASALLHHGWYEETKVIAKRRGLEGAKGVQPKALLEEQVTVMREPELRGLIVELLCASPPSTYSSDYGECLKDACEELGVDLKKVESEVKAQAATAKKAKEKKAAPAKPAPSKPAKASSKSPAPSKTAVPETKPAPAPEATSIYTPPSTSPEVRVPTIPLADWNGLSSAEQHRLTWVSYPGQIGTGYTVWKVGDTTVSAGTINMGTDYQRAIAAIALELGVTLTWEPWVEPPKSKTTPKPAKKLTTKPAKSGASKVFG